MRENRALLPLVLSGSSRENLDTKKAFQTTTTIVPQGSSVLKWWPEVLGWIISVLIVAAIIVVLHAYNGVVTVRWQNQVPVTLNAFLSLLVTFLYMALMVPIPKCIAQLKWNHYASSRPRPLSDIEIFDEASRTVWGSAVLLVTRPNRYRLHPTLVAIIILTWFPRLLAALGAFLTLAVAGVGPFVQQILSQEIVPRQLDGMTPTAPIFNWTSSYSGALTMAIIPRDGDIGVDGIVDQQVDGDAFDAAFYTGLMASGPKDFPVAPICTAANCTWSPYWTLVVESECFNLTDQLNQSSIPWTLPNQLEVGFDGRNSYNITTNYPSLAFPDRGHLLSDFFFTGSQGSRERTDSFGNRTATALECILQLRARKVQAEYKNGEWSETQIGSSISMNDLQARACSPWRRLIAAGMFDYPYIVDATGELFPNDTLQDPLSSLWFSGGDPQDQLTSTCNITIPTNSSSTEPGRTLIFPAIQLLNLSYRLIYLLGRDTGGIIAQAGGKNGGILNYLVSLVSVDPSTQSSLNEAYNITFVERVDNIAKSLTKVLRTEYFNASIRVPGTAYRDTVVYRVEWYWATVPAALVALTLLLLVLTIGDTFGKGLQKRTDSSLALMIFGCDENVRRDLAVAGADLAAVTVAAKQQFVRLGDDHVLTSVGHAVEGRRKGST